MNHVWTDRFDHHQTPRPSDQRSPFQRDKARILHSAAFRRLQAKTQVLGVGTGDFYRTRLTHSLEASQIGQGIADQLRLKHPTLTETLQLNDHLIEALCLAHDIGHPPFGHGGEVALHYIMRDEGGFEGNAQTFRIVTQLEPYTPAHGMNLCRRTALGLIKYLSTLDQLNHDHPPVCDSFRQLQADQWHPPKGLYQDDQAIFNWVLAPLQPGDQRLFGQRVKGKQHFKTRFKSFDCSIMELADDIAYSIHDLEDAIVMGVIQRHDFIQEVAEPIARLSIPELSPSIMSLAEKLFSQHHDRKDAIGALVNTFVTAVSIEVCQEEFEEPLLRHNGVLPALLSQALSEFKRFVYNRVIRKPDMQLLEYKGQQLVMELFEAFSSDPQRLLPENTRQRWKLASTKNKGMRVIADYIAGMTDEYASHLYHQLFIPKSSNIKDLHRS